MPVLTNVRSPYTMATKPNYEPTLMKSGGDPDPPTACGHIGMGNDSFLDFPGPIGLFFHLQQTGWRARERIGGFSPNMLGGYLIP